MSSGAPRRRSGIASCSSAESGAPLVGRPDRARRDRVHAHAVRAELERGGAHEREHRRLGGGVRRAERHRLHAADRRQQHDAPPGPPASTSRRARPGSVTNDDCRLSVDDRGEALRPASPVTDDQSPMGMPPTTWTSPCSGGSRRAAPNARSTASASVASATSATRYESRRVRADALLGDRERVAVDVEPEHVRAGGDERPRCTAVPMPPPPAPATTTVSRRHRARIHSQTHGLPCPRARRSGGTRDPRRDHVRPAARLHAR